MNSIIFQNTIDAAFILDFLFQKARTEMVSPLESPCHSSSEMNIMQVREIQKKNNYANSV